MDGLGEHPFIGGAPVHWGSTRSLIGNTLLSKISFQIPRFQNLEGSEEFVIDLEVTHKKAVNIINYKQS